MERGEGFRFSFSFSSGAGWAERSHAVWCVNGRLRKEEEEQRDKRDDALTVCQISLNRGKMAMKQGCWEAVMTSASASPAAMRQSSTHYGPKQV